MVRFLGGGGGGGKAMLGNCPCCCIGIPLGNMAWVGMAPVEGPLPLRESLWLRREELLGEGDLEWE